MTGITARTCPGLASQSPSWPSDHEFGNQPGPSGTVLTDDDAGRSPTPRWDLPRIWRR